jgi:hypothetical protein
MRLLLELNRASLVEFIPAEAPEGMVVDDVTLETWCLPVDVVPRHVRDEEYVVVVARGQAYSPQRRIELPLEGGGTATTAGRIAFVGKTRDYLSTFVEDADSRSGAGCISMEFPVFGRPGETIELATARVLPDEDGRSQPHVGAWPASFEGIVGAPSRDVTVRIEGGASPRVPCVLKRSL